MLDKSSLYVGLYVDDSAFFNYSNAVEEEMGALLVSTYTVLYDERLGCFFGIKCMSLLLSAHSHKPSNAL